MSILRFVYAVCDLLAIGAGTIVLLGLLTGELSDKWAVRFLRCTLATSVIGLFFSMHDFTLIQGCSMLTVYTSGVAICAWRKFNLSGVWRPIFALTNTIVLYLSVVVAIQVFEQTFRFTRLAPAQFELTSRATQYVVMVLFVVIGIVAVKRFDGRGATHLLRSHTNGVTDKHVF